MTNKQAKIIALGVGLILTSCALKKMIQPVKWIIKKIDSKVEELESKRERKDSWL